MYDDASGPWFFMEPYHVTGEMLETETIALKYPPKNEQATNIKYANRDHYAAITLSWASCLNLMFMEPEYGSRMACFRNLDFFLEEGWLDVQTREMDEGGEEGIGVLVKFWAFTEGHYLHVDQMDLMDIEMWANMITYYGGVN